MPCFRVLMAVLMMTSFCLGQNEEVQGLKKAQELIECFEANQKAIDRYSVALRVELTREYFDGSNQDFSKQDWYLHSVDTDDKRIRHDEIVTKTAVTTDGIHFREVQSPLTLFFEDGNVRQVFHDFATDPLNEESEEEEIEDSMRRQTNFDPWELPILGSELLVPRRNVEPYESNFLTKANVLRVDELGQSVVVTFEYAKGVICNIEFDARFGNMPTSVELEVQEPGFSGVVRAIRTRWANFKNKHWLPVEILVVGGRGHPDKIQQKVTHHFYAHWVIGDYFPDSIFLPERRKGRSPRELKASLLQHAHVSPDSISK